MVDPGAGRCPGGRRPRGKCPAFGTTGQFAESRYVDMDGRPQWQTITNDETDAWADGRVPRSSG